MPQFNAISPDRLLKLVGTPHSPRLIDVRTEADFAAAPYLVPGSTRVDLETIEAFAAASLGQPVIAICQRGHHRSETAAAWLRHHGRSAEVLEGGFEAWRAAGYPTVSAQKLPGRDRQDRTVWVTRARPKIDRIACPWLIRRFVDPNAVFLFVAPPEVPAIAEKFGATPFDVEGVFWSHRDDQCSFDTMLAEFGLETGPLLRLATIVRGADTARPDLAPEASGLLAISLGLSRMYSNDLDQLDAGMQVYDALYRWARDATDETHNWPTSKPNV
ncbi:MAG: chromate resistance protein ChrB domain-containing protein [Rhizobiaceae bacterium]